jgi:mono/diheme cytochrome c family protein
MSWRQNMRKLFLVTLSAALAACAEPAEPPATSAEVAVAPAADAVVVPLTAMQEEGRGIYETVCWTCHGPAGRGDGPAVQAGSVTPPPTFHTRFYAESSAAALERRFRAGMAGADPNHPHMQYVSSLLRTESFAAALAYIPALAYPTEIPGSAINGGRLYAFRCAGCHGQSGRGDGPGSENLIDVRPADFTADTLIAARNWDALFARVREGGRTVHGSSMPPWGIILSEADIWDLVAYLATFQRGALAPPSWSD